jgi:FkbM family methyltransferase
MINKPLHKFLTALHLGLQGQLFKTIREKYLLKRYKQAFSSQKETVLVYYDGIKLELNTKSKLSELIAFNRFEHDDLEFVRFFLKPGGTFVDIGSNIGLYSLIASDKVGKNGKVYAFEPTPETYQRLRNNILVNKFDNIVSYKKAVSNKTGIEQFSISLDGYDAWNSLGKPSEGKIIEKITIDTISLDDFFQMNNITNIDLIKIDVEGWEVNVLRGGENYFRSTKSAALIIEFTDINLLNAGFCAYDLFSILKDFGYQLFSFDAKNKSFNSHKFQESYPYINLIGFKPHHIEMTQTN